MISKSELNNAYKYCERYAKSHYENFPVASLLFPESKRKYIFSIYCFARIADDIADSDEFTKDQKMDILLELDTYLNNLSDNNLSSFEPKYLHL